MTTCLASDSAESGAPWVGAVISATTIAQQIGKSASLVLTDGDILEIRTHVLGEWIDGRPVDLSSKHTDLWEKYRDRPKPVISQR